MHHVMFLKIFFVLKFSFVYLDTIYIINDNNDDDDSDDACFRQYMLDCGYDCEVKDSDSFMNTATLQQYLDDNHVSCILGVHAFHAGKLLQGLHIE